MSNDLLYASELLRIVSGALRLDVLKVRNYVEFLAAKLDQAGESQTAKRLRALLQETDHQLHAVTLTTKALPVDGETRFPLLEQVSTTEQEPAIVLKQQQGDLVKEFLSVCRSLAQLEAHGLITPTTLLLYGPPGCGKSRLARQIARELGMPLFQARLDGLISSFLGSTSKNIRAIFDFAARTPCVLFLDEFDAIAKLRDDKQELGELKRVVNSFLQNLDVLGTQTVLIAATNHHQLLDPAVWRRFSYSLELSWPGAEERRVLWTEFLGQDQVDSKDLDVLSDLTEGFSGAEIREAAFRLKRFQVLQQRPFTMDEGFSTLLRVGAAANSPGKKLVTRFSKLEPRLIARKLKRRNPRLYSHSQIGNLLGVSKATAHRWSLGGGNA
jgi:DNA replication protein DnaC